MVDPLRRLEGVRQLIDQRSYFVLHAPRQVGKTTSLIALGKQLTAEGRYAALLMSCETGRVFPDDPGEAENTILSTWRKEAKNFLPTELQPPPWPVSEPGQRITEGLAAWAEHCPRPLVVFLDEIDALSGMSLMSMLSQLRPQTYKNAHRKRRRDLGLSDFRVEPTGLDPLGDMVREHLRLTDPLQVLAKKEIANDDDD